MLAAKNADMCSKCLVTEPVVRSFISSRNYVVATALRAVWGEKEANRLSTGHRPVATRFFDMSYRAEALLPM